MVDAACKEGGAHFFSSLGFQWVGLAAIVSTCLYMSQNKQIILVEFLSRYLLPERPNPVRCRGLTTHSHTLGAYQHIPGAVYPNYI